MSEKFYSELLIRIESLLPINVQEFNHYLVYADTAIRELITDAVKEYFASKCGYLSQQFYAPITSEELIDIIRSLSRRDMEVFRNHLQQIPISPAGHSLPHLAYNQQEEQLANALEAEKACLRSKIGTMRWIAQDKPMRKNDLIDEFVNAIEEAADEAGNINDFLDDIKDIRQEKLEKKGEQNV